MLLLHGSTSSSATWWQVGPALAQRGWSVCALDLPAHAGDLPSGRPLLPASTAAAVAGAVGRARFELVVGHSFGAAVAVALVAGHPESAARVVLEELPGAGSVDWQAEAAAVRAGAEQARRDPAGALGAARGEHLRWADQDCRHSVEDIAACCQDDVADGLLEGAAWSPVELLEAVQPAVLVVVAPDAAGVNCLQDATALRGPDRVQVVNALRARTCVLDTGHCVHRDDPVGWLAAVDAFAGADETADSG